MTGNIRLFAVLAFCVGILAVGGGRARAHAFSEKPVNPAEALAAYKKMADDNPGDVELQYEYAEVLISAGKLDEAERALLDRTLAVAPGYDAAYDLLSEVYFRRGEFEKALGPLQKIKGKDAKPGALVDEASIYLKLDKPGASLEKAREAINADRSNPGGYLVAGLAWLALGDAKKAERFLEISVRLDACQPMAYEWLSALYDDARTSPLRRLRKLEIIAFSTPRDAVCAPQLFAEVKALMRLTAKK